MEHSMLQWKSPFVKDHHIEPTIVKDHHIGPTIVKDHHVGPLYVKRFLSSDVHYKDSIQNWMLQMVL